MIYLSISASALTFNSKLYYTAFKQNTTSYQTWQEITGFPFTLSKIGSTSNEKYMMFCAFKTNEIILDGKIIVITITLNDILPNDIVVNGVGQLDSSTLVSNSSIYPSALKALSYDQEIIATTRKLNGNSTTITTTYRSSGYINMYPIIWYDYVGRENQSTAIAMANCSLYESVEEAAGSGTTPEEMREVLSSWCEEELLPGIHDSVQSGVAAGMEDALADEKNQASSGAQSGLDELAGALSGVTDDITQAKQSFETLGSALSYSGTTASLTFPAMTVPFLGTISEAQPINLTQQIDNIMPPTLLLIIRCALSIGIVSYPILELIHQLRKLLDKG